MADYEISYAGHGVGFWKIMKGVGIVIADEGMDGWIEREIGSRCGVCALRLTSSRLK